MQQKVNWALLGFDILRIVLAVIAAAALFNVRITWEKAEWWVVMAAVIGLWVVGKLDDRAVD